MTNETSLQQRLSRRSVLAATAGTALVNFIPFQSSAASSAGLDTIEPGILRVASYTGGMPYVGKADENLVGFEGDLLNEAARLLGLKIEVEEGSFEALLANVQSRRVDIGIGSIGWNEKRCETGLFTDPVYYCSSGLGIRSGVVITSVSDLSGKTVATLGGGWWRPALESIGDVTMRVYDGVPAMIAELEAQRVDVVLTDALPLVEAKKRRPDLNIGIMYLPPPSEEFVAKHPGSERFLPFMASWYVPKEQPGLVDALNVVIRSWYKSGLLADTIKKAGGDPVGWLTPLPSFAAMRTAVDRSEGWVPPSI